MIRVPEEQIPTATEFLDMPAQEIRHYLDSGKIPPELSEEQIAQLPPGTEYSYAMARASAGDQFWIARIGSWVEGVKTATEAKEERREQISSYRDVEYREGVPASDFNYLSYDHAELKSYVEPINAADITAYSDTYHDLHKLLQRLSEDLREAVTKSQSGWEGEAADSAHGYFTSLADWSESNSQNAHIASDIIAAESSAASTAKNSMPEPIPFNLEKEMEGWGANPFTAHEQISQAIDKMEESRAEHEKAVQVMTQYDADLQEAGNKQPVFAEPPSFGGGGGDGRGGPSGVIRVPEVSGDTSASGFAGGVPGGAGSPSPGGGGGGFAPPSSPPPPGGVGPSTGAGVVPAVTRPSGLNPGGMTRPPSGGGRNPNRAGFGPGGVGAVPAAGFAPGGGFGPGGGGGGYGGGRIPGAGFGPGGAGGAGAGAGAGAGSGAATGAKPMGGPGAAGPGAAAAAGAGAAGRGGMGAAPMGAGAGAGKGGQGGEDNEHQRPTYLVEADPDDVFGTDQRTAPPVIGA